MADEEASIMDRLRERVGIVERLFDRMDERMSGKLGKDDATKLMEYATEGDTKIKEDFLGRLTDFRVEVREAFKHNEKETASAIFKAVTESEARIMLAIQSLGERRGLHPMVTYGSGGFSVASVIALLLYMNGFRFPGQ